MPHMCIIYYFKTLRLNDLLLYISNKIKGCSGLKFNNIYLRLFKTFKT